MAKLRTREITSPNEATKQRQPTRVLVHLSRLLRARSFSLGAAPDASIQKILTNLQLFGGEVDSSSAIYIGDDPNLEMPSIGLGDKPGLLGPRSFGFLNNIDGIMPLAAPMAERPRQGSVAFVVPRRDALPEIVPLLCRRKMGVSWIISVGDGDPSDVLQFLSLDPATTGVLVALGRGMKAETLKDVLSLKQVALLLPESQKGKESQLCKALARKTATPMISDLEEWLAFGSLFESNLPRSSKAASSLKTSSTIVVFGAGSDFVTAEAKKAKLPPPLIVEQEDILTLEHTLAKAAQTTERLILCGEPEEPISWQSSTSFIRVDPAQPERLKALFKALSYLPAHSVETKPISTEMDPLLISSILDQLPPPLYVGKQSISQEVLSDHDTKRFFHAYGAKVSRQAPANTVTAVLRVAGKIGFPVVLIAPQSEKEVVCQNQADLKHQATLLLARAPHIMVREYFPKAPRFTLEITQEPKIGSVLWGASEGFLLPLSKTEAKDFAGILTKTYSESSKGLIDLLGQISACGSTYSLTCQLEVYLSEVPVIVKAQGTLQRIQKNYESSKK